MKAVMMIDSTMPGSLISASDCRTMVVLEKARVARGVRRDRKSGLAANKRRGSICERAYGQ